MHQCGRQITKQIAHLETVNIIHLFIWNVLMPFSGIDLYSMIDSSNAKFIAYSSHSSVLCVHRLIQSIIIIVYPMRGGQTHSTHTELLQIELIRQLCVVCLGFAMEASRHDLHALSIAPVQLDQFAIRIGAIHLIYFIVIIFFGNRLKIKFHSTLILLFFIMVIFRILRNGKTRKTPTMLSDCEFIKAAPAFASAVDDDCDKIISESQLTKNTRTHIYGGFRWQLY